MDVVFTLGTLLFTHDRVVVSGLGVFTTEIEKAYIHPVEHSFSPEFKKIKFQFDTEVKDDLLKNALKIPDTNTIIDAFVAEVHKGLKAGNKVQLKNIGYLYTHHTGEIILEQDRTFNYVKKNFGLTPFIQEPVKKAVPSEKPVAAAPVAEKKSKAKFVIAALWFIAIVLIGVVVWQYENIGTFLFNDNKVVAEKVNEPAAGITKEKAADTKTIIDSSQSAKVDSVEIAAMDYSKDTSTMEVESKIVAQSETEMPIVEKKKTEPEEKAVKKVAKKVKHKGPRYYVIAGCFESKFKAESLLDELKEKGFENAVLDGKIGRLHRVCYDIFDNRPQASNYMLKLKREGYRGVWIQQK
jgi:nucleoid DNA-binding protein